MENELIKEQHPSAVEREAVLQAKLDFYRVLEVERQKWKECERRLYDDLAGVEEKLRTTRTAHYDTTTLKSKLESAEAPVSRLSRCHFKQYCSGIYAKTQVNYYWNNT